MRKPGTLRKTQFGMIQFRKLQLGKIFEKIGGHLLGDGGKIGGKKCEGRTDLPQDLRTGDMGRCWRQLRV